MCGAISGAGVVLNGNVPSESALSTRALAAEITEFDRRKGWSDGLTRSCAHWLNWKCGIDLGAAREKTCVDHALEAAMSSLPLPDAGEFRTDVSAGTS